MNKRYIDFVPAKKGQPGAGNASARSVAVKPRVVQPQPAVTRSQSAAVRPQPAVTRSRTAMVSRTTVTRTTVAAKATTVPPVVKKAPTDKKPPMGVVEDLNARFVTRDVPKRALGAQLVAAKSVVTKSTSARTASGVAIASGASAAKQQKVKARVLKPAAAKPTAKSVESAPVKLTEKPKSEATYKMPKSPFINQNKVVKRPLSGNIYKREIAEAVKEEPKGPVTIIAKPEKDKHIGVVITIIVTIILGMAAGTVAFLLLPK